MKVSRNGNFCLLVDFGQESYYAHAHLHVSLLFFGFQTAIFIFKHKPSNGTKDLPAPRVSFKFQAILIFSNFFFNEKQAEASYRHLCATALKHLIACFLCQLSSHLGGSLIFPLCVQLVLRRQVSLTSSAIIFIFVFHRSPINMCVVHTIRFRTCSHVHSYTSLVHTDAFYCGDQRVVDDGISRDQAACPQCAGRRVQTQRPEIGIMLGQMYDGRVSKLNSGVVREPDVNEDMRLKLTLNHSGVSRLERESCDRSLVGVASDVQSDAGICDGRTEANSAVEDDWEVIGDVYRTVASEEADDSGAESISLEDAAAMVVERQEGGWRGLTEVETRERLKRLRYGLGPAEIARSLVRG